jgi:predicted RecA/RadA family phage recombinase
MIQTGDTLTLTAPYDVLIGKGFLVGSIFAVASNDTLSGAAVEGVIVGVHDLVKASGVAVAAGARVYWDDSAKAVTGTASSNKLIGVCIVVAASADATIRVRLTAAFTI